MTNSFFIFFFHFFSFWTYYTRKECRKVSHDNSHDKYGKIVHKPCGSCISSIQEIEEDSIKFSLSTQTQSRFKLSWLESYKYNFSLFYLVTTRQLE